MGTRNSRAPSGEELRRTGVSTSVKPVVLAPILYSDGESRTLLVQMTSHDVADFTPRLEVVREFRTAQVEVSILSSQILIGLGASAYETSSRSNDSQARDSKRRMED